MIVRTLMTGWLTLIVALSLAWLTVRVERVGAAPTMWNDELCAPEPHHPCTQGVLQGGWPIPFLLDSPGISVMGKLAPGEDLFRPKGFALDTLVIWLLVWGLVTVAARRQRHSPFSIAADSSR
ncbi:MAG: hypothetical protein ACJ77T_05815 [Gemmatimonadaceae bacterium]